MTRGEADAKRAADRDAALVRSEALRILKAAVADAFKAGVSERELLTAVREALIVLSRLTAANAVAYAIVRLDNR